MDEATIWEHTVYNVVHGSRAYGTHTPSSDYDEKGIVVIPFPEYYFGFSKFEQKDSGWKDGSDRVIYDVRKFFKLALSCNPNIIEVLYVPEDNIKDISFPGSRIRRFRDRFLSKKAHATFSGYAIAQMRRIERRVANMARPGGKKDPKIWKHAAHIIRLCRMGEEILRDGEVNVARKDAKYLLKIRRGEVPLKEIMREGRERLEIIDSLKDKSPLPDEPDRNGAEALMVDIIEIALLEQRMRERNGR